MAHLRRLTADSARKLARFGWQQVLDGELQTGINALEEAFIALPFDIELKKALGLAYARAQRPAEALACLRSVVLHRPDDIEVHCVMGELSLERRDFKSMAESLARCLQLDPNAKHPSGVRARGLIKKAEKHLKQATGK